MSIVKFPHLEEELPPLVVIGLIGQPQAGKSYYAYEAGFSLMKDGEGDRILFLSTEKPTDFSLKKWDAPLEKQYGVKPRLVFKFLPNAIELLRFIGVELEIEIGEGKTEAKPTKIDIKNSDMFKLLKEGKYSELIIDSITAVFDSLAVGGRQNLPLRTQVEEIFYNVLIELLVTANAKIRIFTTHHVTFNPTNPYEIREHIRAKGGKIIQHYSEIVYAIEHKDRPHGYRVFHVVRYPDIPEYGKAYDMLITSEGYRKTNAEEIEKLKVAMKKSAS